MTKRNKKIKKSFFRKVHAQALIFFVLYTIISKAIFIKSVTLTNIHAAFFIPYFYGVLCGIVFLYLFNHEDFFHFMKDIEKKEKKEEESLLKRFLHYGKVASVLIIATVGGPVLSALTIRLLLNKFWYKYLLIALGNITSTILAVSLARGALSLFI